MAEHARVGVSTCVALPEWPLCQPVRQQRISKAIDKLGYTRSWTARNLSLGRRGCIGVVTDSTLDPWFIQLLAGIEEELSERDSSLMLASLELRGHYDASPVFQWIRDKRVDGLIIAKSQKRERSLLRTAVEAQLTVTVVPDEPIDHVPVLRCNNLTGSGGISNGANHSREYGVRTGPGDLAVASAVGKRAIQLLIWRYLRIPRRLPHCRRRRRIGHRIRIVIRQTEPIRLTKTIRLTKAIRGRICRSCAAPALRRR